MDNSNCKTNAKNKTQRKRQRADCTVSFKALEHFRSVTEEDSSNDKIKTHICCHCNVQVNGSKGWNLAQHLQNCHLNIYEEITGQKETPELKRLHFIQNCVEIISVNGRPFSYLLDSGFQALVKEKLTELHEAGYGINLSHQNLVEVKQHLKETSQQIQEEIRKETENRPLSLLVDIVTRQRRSICGFSVQYIFNGQLKIRSIGMVELLHSHTGKYIAEVIIKRLNEFGINLKQIITITTDNAANVLKMVRDINSHLQAAVDNAKQATDYNASNENEASNEDANALIEELLCDETKVTDDEAYEQLFEEVEFNRDNSTLLNVMSTEILSFGIDIWDITGVNCAAHTLQLATKDSISKLPQPIKNVIELCRLVCKFLRLKSTSVAMDIIGVEYTLPRLENDTRWGSMYLMVRFLLLLFLLFIFIYIAFFYCTAVRHKKQ